MNSSFSYSFMGIVFLEATKNLKNIQEVFFLKQNKRWISLALSAVIGFSGLGVGTTNWATVSPQTPPPLKVTTFNDVPSNHYASEAIKTMNSLGIINGYPDGSFKPEAEVRRV